MTDDDRKRATATETTPAGDDDDAGVVLSVPHIALFQDIGAVSELRTTDPNRYELGAEIARGGMGRIVEALDRDQHRRVAIKMLLRGGHEAARRFVREARITARLQHPAIVALYEVARWQSGEPFFAMKLVAGRSLDDAASNAKTMKQRLALLPHLVAATEALAYAHGEGIVHRDLKPSNVLVGRFGETVVIDWGLAKDVRSRDANDALPPPSGPYRDSERSAKLTAIGQALGTPCYMPPEQARGGDVDARSDVYALGAMLYHVLAGAPPYEGETSKQTIDRVLNEPPKPLAERAPDAPPDLIALVEKAMARAPDHRYPTASEMADDLQRFVAGKLVSAHSYGMGALISRWIAKHRALVAVASVLVVALVTTGVMSVRRIAHERDRADAQKTIADRERSAAIVQRDAAERLVEFMLGDLRARLEPVGRLDVLEGVGAKIDEYYRTASPSSALVDPAALVRRAAALATLGGVESSKHNVDAARNAYAASIDLATRALALSPDDADAQLRLAESHARLAALATEVGDLDGATQEIALATALATPHANDGGAAWILVAAKLRSDTAFVLQQRGDVEGAYAAARDANAGMTRAAAADPSNDDAEREVAWSWQVLGDLEVERGDLDAAVEDYRRAIALRERNKGDPRDAARAIDRAWGHSALGSAELSRGNAQVALVAFREAFEIRKALVARDPENAVWRRFLAYSHAVLCDAEIATGAIDAATADCRASLAISQALAEADRDDAKDARDVALAHKNLGKALLAAKHTEEALAAMEAAVASADAIAAKRASATSDQVLARCRRWLGVAELASKKLDRARESYRAAIALAEKLAGAARGDATAREELAAARLLGGDVETALGDRARARALYTDASTGYSDLAKRSPHDATLHAAMLDAKAKSERPAR